MWGTIARVSTVHPSHEEMISAFRGISDTIHNYFDDESIYSKSSKVLAHNLTSLADNLDAQFQSISNFKKDFNKFDSVSKQLRVVSSNVGIEGKAGWSLQEIRPLRPEGQETRH